MKRALAGVRRVRVAWALWREVLAVAFARQVEFPRRALLPSGATLGLVLKEQPEYLHQPGVLLQEMWMF